MISEIKKDLDSIIKEITKIDKKEIQEILSLNFSKNINKTLRVLEIDNWLNFKNKEKENKEKLKEVLKIELENRVETLTDTNFFYFYFILNKVGCFSYQDFDEVNLKIAKTSETLQKKLLKDIIFYLNNQPLKGPKKHYESYEEVEKLKRNLGYIPTIYNPARILGRLISSFKKVNFNLILKELKIEPYIYYLMQFNSKAFIDSLNDINKLYLKHENDKQYKYKIILSINSVTSNSEISINSRKALKEIIQKDLKNIGKYIFNEIYKNKYLIKENSIYNEIFVEILNDKTYRKKYLESLKWGKDFETFTLYILINELDEKNQISSKDSKYYANAFIEEYYNTEYKLEKSFYLYYVPLSETKHYMNLFFLMKGFMEIGDKFFHLLKKELQEMTYQYYSKEYDVIYSLNKKIEELLILHLLIFEVRESEPALINWMSKNLTLIENKILKQFIYNKKASGLLNNEDLLLTWLKKVNKLDNNDIFKKIFKLVLENFSEELV